MFTGLALGMGEISGLDKKRADARLTVRPMFPLQDLARGESIAVNGACLSVETFDSRSFSAYASGETLSLTNLGSLSSGSRVNLERALALGDRLGGHMVSGHVDGLAVVESISEAGASRLIRVLFPEEFAAQVIPKGSVALDGISLTVNRCGRDFLEVNVIPETLGATTAGSWTPGRKLNFETDLIGKYVERMLGSFRDREPQPRLTLDFLREHGF